MWADGDPLWITWALSVTLGSLLAGIGAFTYVKTKAAFSWLTTFGVLGAVVAMVMVWKRIIPELQDLKAGDAIAIAPGMGYTVAGIEKEQALILQSRMDTARWESLSDNDPLPEKYLISSWVWYLEEIDEETTRMIVRVRTDCSPGLLSTLTTTVPNQLGNLVMQPKTLRVLKQRAEMNVW